MNLKYPIYIKSGEDQEKHLISLNVKQKAKNANINIYLLDSESNSRTKVSSIQTTH